MFQFFVTWATKNKSEFTIFKFFTHSLSFFTQGLFIGRVFAAVFFYVGSLSHRSVLINFCFFSNSFISFDLDFLFDQERTLFFFCVSWISFSVFSYRKRYIALDRIKDRFFLLLASFVASMFILVFRSNMFLIMIGWDGLGVTSFLLVIYFQNKTSMNAGLITVLTNRMGDVFLLSAIALIISLNQWNTTILGARISRDPNSIILILLIFGAFTKSAQVPFSRWLPAAMAAPTPVSSLVHSRTLVTAGIFLLLRFKRFFLEMTTLPLFFGCLTICIAGMVGLMEADFKKIVALSTLSQLGLIIASFGLGAFSFTLFHLITHAFFKALLFLSTGITIHAAKDYQDLRAISLPSQRTPRTISIILVANVRLIGFPFLAGFYSKDLILEFMLSQRVNPIIIFLFFWGTALTVLYSIRFLYYSRNSFRKSSVCFTHSERDLIAFSSYDKLFGLAVFRGATLNWVFLPFAPSLFLTTEAKNFTFLLILRRLICSLFYRNMLTKANHISFLKWSLRSIWSLVFISTSFAKKNVLASTQTFDKLAEKFILRDLLFLNNRKRLNFYRPVLKSRRLSSFYFIFFLRVFFLFFTKWV